MKTFKLEQIEWQKSDRQARFDAEFLFHANYKYKYKYYLFDFYPIVGATLRKTK